MSHEAQNDTFDKYPHINRVEVIDADGRIFARRYVESGAHVAIQDDGRTIKIFAGTPYRGTGVGVGAPGGSGILGTPHHAGGDPEAAGRSEEEEGPGEPAR